ncbi:MAG: threonyl-tRNA synthetase editing domain-containing protein [Candidatus Hodarchaeales archaeon]|jgi:threonyl-tRNA synthetase
MQLLLIHSDGFSWKVTDKAVINPEPLIDVLGEYTTEKSVLVVFIAIEDVDTLKTSEVISLANSEIIQALQDIGETNVILYPWVHLAKAIPAKPASALLMMKSFYTNLRENFPEIELIRAPFGYYKSFSIRCKGHALAERSKEIIIHKKDQMTEITPEITTAIQAEDEIKSQFFILTQSGDRTPYRSFTYTKFERLQTFVNYETAKDRRVSSPPKHVALMKQLELVDYEGGSDAGNFRILPRGYVVKQLIEKHVTEIAVEYGAMVVETPIMYSYEHPSLKKYLERFPARQYIVKSGQKDYFLRFSACFGQFLTMSDAIISYRQLPMKMFELTDSFRREQRGELAGIRRLRAFTMPDLHTIASDMEMAKNEFETQFKLATQYLNSTL